MQAVGRLGSYISRSVYTVSAPFHPFGGAVDIITVVQPDGTFKSSPWYVRFGKFQGVLKTREKVVTISVNGVEADFHMYLNHKGEAYFLTEVDEGEGELACSPPSISGEENNRTVSNRVPLKSISCNYDSKCSENEKNAITRTYSRPYSIFGLVFGKKSTEEDENASGLYKTQSLQRAEIAADLLDLRWSTNLDSPRRKKNNNNINNASGFSDVSEDIDSINLVSHSSYIVGTEESVPISGESVVDEYSLSVSARRTEDQIADESIVKSQESSMTGEEEQLLFGNLDGVHESFDANSCSGFSLDQSVINDYIDNVSPQRMGGLRSVPSESCIKDIGHVESESVQKVARSLPIMGPLSDELGKERDKQQSPSARTMCKEGHADTCTTTSPRSIDESRSSWPFTFSKSNSMEDSPQIETNGVVNPIADGGKELTEVKKNKKTFIRTLTPTSEQLASLKLKEGKNIIAFTFQTAMLGDQQVDAQIFMWRWDSRIVISDVDGTITRSDLLGQVMPLVGMDWSQTGVAHLFSAIKENGYQLIFLSARSISQSFITRQFLNNIKQDGKFLPDGPVVISPDGLFPSLFREVVRRAPHEFKISCLEDIKALFPADTNPFYAGFGNRDTDEFSYLKVGIPRGKIFIINPKGEIVVNRSVETKSYLSLHELVHDMFPIITSSEQEDYNSWNYWKIPPPIIDM